MNDPMNNNQGEIKKKGRGGSRPGAGRKVGSVNKIQGGEFLDAYFKTHGTHLKDDLVRDMQEARLRGDYDMLFKYQTAFAKYYFSDVQQVDITSGGQPMQSNFNFPTKELPDWSSIPVTITTVEK